MKPSTQTLVALFIHVAFAVILLFFIIGYIITKSQFSLISIAVIITIVMAIRIFHDGFFASYILLNLIKQNDDDDDDDKKVMA